MKKTMMTVLLVGLLACSAAANTWTGLGTDNYWNTPGNWLENAKPAFTGTATFDGDASTTPNPDTHGAAQTGVAIEFLTAGWVISDSIGTGYLRVDGGLFITSKGAGVNQIKANINASGAPAVGINIDSGNTLRISGFFAPGNVNLGTSAGTLVWDGPDQIADSSAMVVNTGITMLANTKVGYTMTATAGTIGGTGSVMGYQYGVSTLGGTAVLAPGGNGTYGDEIGTLLWTCNSTTIRHTLQLDSGASVKIQLGTTLASHDQLLLNFASTGRLAINSGVTLNLYGGTIQAGDYTIIANVNEAATNIFGTFTTVNFNDSPIDPNRFVVTYNTDSIVLSVLPVPEPATMALLGLGLVGLVSRRKRA